MEHHAHDAPDRRTWQGEAQMISDAWQRSSQHNAATASSETHVGTHMSNVERSSEGLAASTSQQADESSHENAPLRATYQPYVASPLRASMQSQQIASTSQETTPTASPEDSTTTLAAATRYNASMQRGEKSQMASRLEGAFSQTPSSYGTPSASQHSASPYYAPPWRPSTLPDDSDADRTPQQTQLTLGDPIPVGGEATASSRLLSSSLNTMQLRAATPTNDVDYRLGPSDIGHRAAAGTNNGAGYASSVDAEYYSAPPSRLVSRTPTPVAGFRAAARPGSPDGVFSASDISDDEDCDYSSGGAFGWGALFGLGNNDRYGDAPYRLANQGGQKGYQPLPGPREWTPSDTSGKHIQSQRESPRTYHARYTPKSPDASLMQEGRHYSRRGRRRQKSPSILPAPLRVASTFFGKIFRAIFGPIHPLTILIALALVAGFVTSVTMLIMYILNPDKEPLPWRTYCMQQLPFPHALADALAPVNVVIGVLTVDSKYERRNLIRNTYARHTLPTDENGNPTANIQVKFILGKVRKAHANRIALEMEAYNDIVVLDMEETQSARKTHGFFKWAAENATIPFLRPIAPAKGYSGYAKDVFVPSPSQPGGLAAWQSKSATPTSTIAAPSIPIVSSESSDEQTRFQVAWKKVDYVVKADDDTFIVLDELERHLRVAPRELTYWGYLVKNWFMGGEAYALSYDLVDWMAHSPEVSRTAKGKEDIRTPQWIALHPNRSSINWVSEHCWIYDHPKANTPYSHGYLFPDYVEKIKLEGRHGLSEQEIAYRGGEHASQWYSTVNKWHQKYHVPRQGMTAEEQVEALVEGGGRWSGTWVRGDDGISSERWVPYHEIVYEASDDRLRPSVTDSKGRAALAADVGLEPYSGLPIYGTIDRSHSSNSSAFADSLTPPFEVRNATARGTQERKAKDADADSAAQRRRDVFGDLATIPRKYFGNKANVKGQGEGQFPPDATTRFMPRPTPKDEYGEWDALRAMRYLNRPHGGTVIVHYLKRTEYWLETALALSGKGKLWTDGAGGRGKEWRMGGSPLVRGSDGYILEGRSAPRQPMKGSTL